MSARQKEESGHLTVNADRKDTLMRIEGVVPAREGILPTGHREKEAITPTDPAEKALQLGQTAPRRRL
jgi:hypothetical protein